MKISELIADPVESSRQAGLRYVTDSKPSITRKRRGKSFRYFNPDGNPGQGSHRELRRAGEEAIARSSHSLRQEELDLLNLLERRAKLAA